MPMGPGFNVAGDNAVGDIYDQLLQANTARRPGAATTRVGRDGAFPWVGPNPANPSPLAEALTQPAAPAVQQGPQIFEGGIQTGGPGFNPDDPGARNLRAMQDSILQQNVARMGLARQMDGVSQMVGTSPAERQMLRAGMIQQFGRGQNAQLETQNRGQGVMPNQDWNVQQGTAADEARVRLELARAQAAMSPEAVRNRFFDRLPAGTPAAEAIRLADAEEAAGRFATPQIDPAFVFGGAGPRPRNPVAIPPQTQDFPIAPPLPIIQQGPAPAPAPTPIAPVRPTAPGLMAPPQTIPPQTLEAMRRLLTVIPAIARPAAERAIVQQMNR